MTRSAQSGMTLIEVIVALVIITAAAGTILGVMASISRNSADAMRATQRASVAKAYLDEILRKPLACSGVPLTRKDFSCVNHFNGLSEYVTDGNGNAVPGLSGYRVQISVNAGAIPTIPSIDQRLVTVTVTDPYDAQGPTVLSGLRTQHP